MKRLLITLTAITIALPAVAAADPKGGKGPKHSGRPVTEVVSPSDARKPYATPRGRATKVKATPPGLAKKPYAMPPGQAKKMWAEGQRLPKQYYTGSRYAVADPSQHSLSPAPYGQHWIRVGDNYYLAQTKTGLISQTISALLR